MKNKRGMKNKKGKHRGRTEKWALALAAVMLIVFTAGCGRTASQKENSVFRGDPDAVRIFVRANSSYEEALTEQFPDIKFDFYHYGGLNTTMIMEYLLENDDLGDLCITSLQMDREIAKAHLLDLSGYAFCSNYDPSILTQFDVDGEIYQLPGYVTVRNIVYNKDMFKEHGWQVPEDFQGLVDLCRQIREETEGITPIVMGGAATGYYFTTMTTYSQAEFLYTPEGRQWEEDWRSGKAKAGKGFGEGIQMTQQLIDAGAFDYEKNLDLWDAGLFRDRMLTQEAAMMFLWGGHTPVANMMVEQDEIEFALMPFRNQDGQAFVGTNIPYYVGISKELSNKGNEKKLEKVLRIAEWLSTQEGMSSFSTEALSAVFPLNEGKNGEVLPIFQQFWDDNLTSIKAPMLYAGYEDIMVPSAEKILAAIQGEGRLDDLDKFMDELHQSYLANGTEAIAAGSFAKNFTHEETVQTMAHILHTRGDSDITLVSSGDYINDIMNSGGVYAQFYEGLVIKDQLTCYLPGANITREMVQMTLKGSRIKQLLENGKHTTLTDAGHQDTESDEGAVSTADFVYYFDGLKVKWKDGKIKSAVLENGEELSDEKEYTVTFAPGDYTIELEEEGQPKELPYTAREVLEEYMEQNSPISPSEKLR